MATSGRCFYSYARLINLLRIFLRTFLRAFAGEDANDSRSSLELADGLVFRCVCSNPFSPSGVTGSVYEEGNFSFPGRRCILIDVGHFAVDGYVCIISLWLASNYLGMFANINNNRI